MTAGLFATDPLSLGPYRMLGRLGGGGMGQVYLARSPGGRLVAVKVIRPEWTNNTANTVYIYYTESSSFAGYTGSVPANSSVGSSIAVGGTYLVESPMGTCIGAVQINATSGTVTIS